MKREKRKSAGHVPLAGATPVSKTAEASAPPPGEPYLSEHQQKYWFLALLLLTLLAPFASILLAPGGRVLGNPRCDTPSAYYFINYFAAQCWRQGTIPLWNPYIMLGIPFVGEGQASVFHPLSFLFVFLPTGLAINWLIASSFTLTGLFFYGYLRALGLGRPAAWLGAVTWSFSSAMISRIYAGHLNILLTFISIPPIMMFWEKYRAGGGVRWLAGISFAYALMILAFYPQVLYIFSLFFLGYVLIQSALAIQDRTSDWRREGRTIVRLGVFILLGIGLGAVQLFPSLDFAAKSFRQTVSIGFCGSYSFPPENLLTPLAPGFFGTALTIPTRLYWGRFNFWEMWLYLGILPLIMAAVGAWAAPRRQRLVLVPLALGFLLLGLGSNTPLFPLVYKYIPGFNVFRGPCKNMLITLFCLVTLSAHGFESLLGEAEEGRRRRARVIAGTAGVFLLLVIAAATVRFGLPGKPDAPGSAWRLFYTWVQSGQTAGADTVPADLLRTTAANAARALVRATLLIALGLAVIALLRPPRWRRFLFPAAALLVLGDLLGVFLPLIKTFDESITRYPQGFREDFRAAIGEFTYPPRILNPNPTPNIAIRYGYSSPFGYVGNTLQRYNDFINVLQGAPLDYPRAESLTPRFSPAFRLLAFDAMVIDRQNVAPGTKILRRLGGGRVLVPYEEIQEKIPRAFLAAAPRYFARREEALGYVFSGADVQASPSIEHRRAPLAAAPLDPDESVRFVSWGLHRVVLEVKANRPRELVLCAMFERNWTARVNGERVPVEPANYIYRAVQVPAGTSRVVFKYHPVAFYWGVAVSAVSLALLLFLSARAGLRRLPRRAARELPPSTRDWLRRRRGAPRALESPVAFIPATLGK